MAETIGQVIKHLRKEKKMSLRELSALSDFSHAYVSQIESGDRNASVQILTKIAKALDVSKVYLFRMAGYLDETDILELVDENTRLKNELELLKKNG